MLFRSALYIRYHAMKLLAGTCMKVLIYGREPLVSKISRILVQYGIEMAEVPNTANTPDCFEYREKPDLALIDRNAEDAVSTCRNIRKSWGIPVVLIMGRDEGEWEGLEGFMASGYVPNTSRNSELVAHLNAIYRRTTLFEKGAVAR